MNVKMFLGMMAMCAILPLGKSEACTGNTFDQSRTACERIRGIICYCFEMGNERDRTAVFDEGKI